MSAKAPTRLSIVGPGDALTGVAPIAFEKASRTCQSGDAMHRGLLAICCTLARHGLRRVIAPSSRGPLTRALVHAEAFLQGTHSLRALKQARTECFEAIPEVIKGTLEALHASVPTADSAATALTGHARAVLWRYAGLAARLGADAVVLTLDGVKEPSLLSQVAQQVAAARAYQAAGLGAARQREFVQQAIAQATFETQALPASGHDTNALALQVLHEYLGVRWKVLHDAERAYIDQFVNWALAGAPRSL